MLHVSHWPLYCNQQVLLDVQSIRNDYTKCTRENKKRLYKIPKPRLDHFLLRFLFFVLRVWKFWGNFLALYSRSCNDVFKDYFVIYENANFHNWFSQPYNDWIEGWAKLCLGRYSIQIFAKPLKTIFLKVDLTSLNKLQICRILPYFLCKQNR